MELVQELFVTASLALLLSFLVAKLVAMALASEACRASDFKSRNVSEEIILEELRFGETLRVQGFESEKMFESVVEAVEKMDEVFGEDAPEVEEIVETVLTAEKIEEKRYDAPKILPDGASGKEFGSVEFPERLLVERSSEEAVFAENSGGSDLDLVEEANIDDLGNEKPQSREAQAVDPQSVNDHVVACEPEEVRAPESDDDDDDDDWEGIEMTDLEHVFTAASKFVGSMDKDRWAKVRGNLQMELYGLHKVATEGTCHEPQPMALKVSARAKWNAWQRLGNITPEVAMEQYICHLSDKVPGWMDGSSAGDIKPESFEGEISSASAPIKNSFLHHYLNSTTEREVKPWAQRGDPAPGFDLENRGGE